MNDLTDGVGTVEAPNSTETTDTLEGIKKLALDLGFDVATAHSFDSYDFESKSNALNCLRTFLESLSAEELERLRSLNVSFKLDKGDAEVCTDAKFCTYIGDNPKEEIFEALQDTASRGAGFTHNEEAPPNGESLTHLLKFFEPYIKGRPNFRDASFKDLEHSDKIAVCLEAHNALMIVSMRPECTDWLKSCEVTLSGEKGISYNAPELKIGPGVSRREIVDFIKLQVAENERILQRKKEAEVEEPSREPETEITSALGKESIIVRVGDPVSWQETESRPGNGNGEIISFENGEGGITYANIRDKYNGELRIPADELSFIKPEPVVPQVPKEEDNKEEDAVPEWKKGEEWQMFEDLRKGAAREEINKQKSGLTGLSTQQMNYKDQRDLIEKKIIETMKREGSYDTLSREEQANLDKEINDTVFEELAEKEHAAYIQAIKEVRGERLGGKVKEIAQNVASSVAFKWYLSQNRFVRIGMTAALAVGIGYGVGTIAAAGVISTAGMRMVRGAASFGGATLGRAIGAKRWNIEDVNKKEKEEIEVIKNSGFSLEEQSNELKKVIEQADRDRKKLALKKSALTIGMGAGAGILSGLAEHIIGGLHAEPAPMGIKPRPEPAIEPVKNVEQPAITDKPVEVVRMPEAAELFDNVEAVRHTALAGDSQWRLLEKTLDHNERFANLSKGSRAWLVDTLIRNKINPDPSQYGFKPNGDLFIGDKIDFHKIFDNKEEINTLLTKAEDLPSLQIKNSLALHDEATKLVQKLEGTKIPTAGPDDLPKMFADEPPPEMKVEPSVPKANPEMAPSDLPVKTEIVQPAAIGLVGLGAVGVGAMNKVVSIEDANQKRERIQREISEAKARMEEIENRNAVGRGADVGLERVMPINMRVGLDGKRSYTFDAAVEKAHRDDINQIYNEKGWWGNVKVEGVKTQTWGWAQRLSADEIVQYATGDSRKSKLPGNVVEALNKPPHAVMLDYVRYLVGEVEKANGDIHARQGESLGEFLKRLGNHLFTFHSKQQKIAA